MTLGKSKQAFVINISFFPDVRSTWLGIAMSERPVIIKRLGIV